MIVSKDTKLGIFRTGMWYDWAYTARYQHPSNILTHQDTPLPNFHEHFITQAFHPFAEFEWHFTPKLVVTTGIKAADYNMHLNQYQDNGKTVGCLGGVLSTYPSALPLFGGAPACIRGVNLPFTASTITTGYPTVTARYRLARGWSAYAELPEGSIIPPSAVFDVPGGNILTPQKPTLAKTYQTGSVWQYSRWTLDFDLYYVYFENGFDSYTEPATGEAVFVPTGPSNTKGIEFEGNYALGHGFGIYGNASFGSAKYAEGPSYPNGWEWVANTPDNIEGVSFLYQQYDWDIGLVYKRIGQYYNDNGSYPYKINGLTLPYALDEAVTIQPWQRVNLFFNYTIKRGSLLRGTKVQFAINKFCEQPQPCRNYARECPHSGRSLRFGPWGSTQSDAWAQLHHYLHRRLRAEAVELGACLCKHLLDKSMVIKQASGDL